MFNNIGSKVKILAWIECIAGIILSVISGLITLISGQIIIALVVVIAGIVISWLSSLALYAIGQIAENTEKILDKLDDTKNQKPESIKVIRQTQSTTSSPRTNIKNNSSQTNAKDEGWICSCGAKNSGASDTCYICFKSRN